MVGYYDNFNGLKCCTWEGPTLHNFVSITQGVLSAMCRIRYFKKSSLCPQDWVNLVTALHSENVEIRRHPANVTRLRRRRGAWRRVDNSVISFSDSSWICRGEHSAEWRRHCAGRWWGRDGGGVRSNDGNRMSGGRFEAASPSDTRSGLNCQIRIFRATGAQRVRSTFPNKFPSENFRSGQRE